MTDLLRWARPGTRYLLALGGWTAFAGAQGIQPRDVRWDRPMPLAGVSTLVRNATIAFVGDTAWIAGNETGADTAASRLLSLSRIPGGPDVGPAGNHQFVHPKLAVGPRGALHLVWAEFDAPLPMRAWLPQQRTLWHSVRIGGRWSAPQKIFGPAAVQWTASDGRLAVDAAGQLRVLAWSGGNGSNGLVQLRQTAGSWSADLPRTLVTQPEMAMDVAGDSVWQAFTIGQGGTTGEAEGFVMRHRSSAAGSWSRVSLGAPPRAAVAMHPQFVRSNGQRYLVWGQVRWNVVGLDTLRLAAVHGGKARMVATVPLPANANVFSAAANPCGGVTVLVETIERRPNAYEIGIAPSGRATTRRLTEEGTSAIFVAAGSNGRDQLAVYTTADSTGLKVVSSVRRGCR